MEPGREAERREGLSGQSAQVADKMLEYACLGSCVIREALVKPTQYQFMSLACDNPYFLEREGAKKTKYSLNF